MRTRTRPTIVRGVFHHPGADRIVFHVAKCISQVTVAKHTGLWALFPKVSVQRILFVEALYVDAVAPMKNSFYRVVTRRRRDKMNMIGHQCIGMDGELMGVRALRKEPEIKQPILFVAKHIKTANSALRDVMRHPGNNDTSNSRHGRKPVWGGQTKGGNRIAHSGPRGKDLVRVPELAIVRPKNR
jgi:hypothetical protein